MTRKVEFTLQAHDHASAAIRKTEHSIEELTRANTRYEAAARDLNFALRSNLITEAQHAQSLSQEKRLVDEAAQAHRRYQREVLQSNKAQAAHHAAPVSRTGGMLQAGWSKAGGFAGAMGAVGLGGVSVGLIARQAADTIEESYARLDSLAKTARKLGVDPRELQKLQYAGDREGVDGSTFDSAMQRFTKNVSEAAIGTGKAKASLRELKLEAAELNSLPLAERFYRVSDALRAVASNEDRMRLTMKLFGDSGADMVNVLSLGGDALRKLVEEREKFPGLIREDELARVEAASDALSDMKLAVKGAADEVTVSLAPAIEDCANSISGMFGEFRKWRDSLPDRAKGSTADRKAQLQQELNEAGFKKGDTVGNLQALATPQGVMLAGRAAAQRAEEAELEKTKKLGAGAIDLAATNAARGMTEEKLRGIKHHADEKAAFDKYRFEKDPKHVIESTKQIGADNQQHLLKEFNEEGAKLMAGLRAAIPFDTRKAAGDVIGRVAEDPASLLSLLPRAASDALAAVKVPDAYSPDKEVSRMRESLRTPQELFADELAHLEALRAKGLDDETFRRGRREAEERRDRELLPDRRDRKGPPPELQAFVSRTLTRAPANYSPEEKVATNTAELLKDSRQARREATIQSRAMERLIRAVEDSKPTVAGPT